MPNRWIRPRLELREVDKMADRWIPIMLTGLMLILSLLFLTLYIYVANGNGVFENIELVSFILFLTSTIATIVSIGAWDIGEETK